MRPNCYLKPLLLLLSILGFGSARAQTVVNIPNVEDIFGGRINAITGYSKSSDSSVIYISTESANSLFYTTVYNPQGSGFTFRRYRSIPTADADDNIGSAIQLLAAHEESGLLFFVNNGLYSTSPSATSLTTISSYNTSALKIQDSILFFIQGTQLYWGKLNSAGTYTQDAAAPISIGSVPSFPITIDINPTNNYLYIGFGGTSPSIYKSTSYWYSFGSGTTFSSLSMGSIPASTTYSGFGISPSGRIFLGGQLTSGFNAYKAFRYTDNDGSAWTHVSTSVSGVTGSSMAFSGTATAYRVHFAKCYSTDQGTTWQEFGNVSQQTHPNDGAVYVDPNDSMTVYMTSDQGIAYSVNGGSVMHEMDRGVEAVQVADISMTSSKNTAWIASKAGIRKVTNYQSTKDWTRAIFPNGDGSPYYAAEMQAGDTNTVYVGNLRVYKTTNSGSTWSQVFSAENAPYSWPQTAIHIEAIEVCPWDTNIVFAGYYFNDSIKGGLFYSMDAGVTWNQKYLYASSGYYDVDVYDIIFNIEGTDTICYVGVEYDLSHPTGRSIYKLTKSGSSWTAAQDMNGATTSVGYAITASIHDLCRSYTGDTLFACGTDAGTNHPIAYYKPITATGKWTPFTTSGFPMDSGAIGYAVTQGIDTIYVAVENDVYYLASAASAWQLGYSYPEGTEINFLYYDELLVGTETGLYGHDGFVAQPASLTLTVMLQGLYVGGGMMTPALNNADPSYSALVADTIEVELRSASAPYTLIESQNLLLSTSGVATMSPGIASNGSSYYIVVKHRNSLETWSASAVTLSSTSTYNFSTAANKAYGNNLKSLGSGIYGIYSGDINQDGNIDFSDYPSLDIDAINGSTGYRLCDLNGDGTVDFSDYPLIDLNSVNAVSVSQP